MAAAVVLVAIGLTAVAGLVVGRSDGSPVRGVTAAVPSVTDEGAEPVARGGRLTGDDRATPSPSAPAVTEAPAREVVAEVDEPAPTRPATATTAQPPDGAAAAEDTQTDRCTEERGSARGRDASGSRRGGAACR